LIKKAESNPKSVKKDVSVKAAMGPNWYKQKNLNLSGKGQKSIKFSKVLLILVAV